MNPPPRVEVVDHRHSCPWNLVPRVAAVTGVLADVVQHDTAKAAHVLCPGMQGLVTTYGLREDAVIDAVPRFIATMEVIPDIEATPRAVYSGAFGWICGDGRADLGVVIRSLTTTGDGNRELGTGGGITVRSDVHEELAESRWKAERLLRVLD